MSKEQLPALTRPENKGVVDRNNSSVKPYELDPELMQLRIASLMIEKMGTPSVLEKQFAVRYGIFTALNNSYMNKTGYDSSLRLAVYQKYAENSINENGLYFHNFWAWLNKPKYIIQGNAATMGMPQEEEKQSVIGRVIGWFRGGKKNDGSQQQ